MNKKRQREKKHANPIYLPNFHREIQKVPQLCFVELFMDKEFLGGPF